MHHLTVGAYIKRLSTYAIPAMLAGTLAAGPVLAQGEPEDIPVIKVFATGGTIANTPDGRISVESIIEELPEVTELADLRVEDVTRVGSSSLTWQEFIDTARAIENTLENESEVDGIVVTIGSNTSEDMAYFLNLVVDSDIPIVVTAAQRQRTTRSEDSSRNFIDSLITAGSEDASGMGVMLVANELIHSARAVAKNVVSRVDTWESLDVGALGMISNGEAIFYNSSLRRHTTDSEFSLDGIETAADLPQVDILYSYVGAPGGLVEAAIDGGADGLVIAGFATGTAHRVEQRPALEAAAEDGFPVVTANRGTSGRIPPDDGLFIGADTLTPQKAQILLMMALTVTDDIAEIQRIFGEY